MSVGGQPDLAGLRDTAWDKRVPNMAVGSTLEKIVVVRNHLWRGKYGHLCKNECSLPETPRLYQSFMYIHCSYTVPWMWQCQGKRLGIGEGEVEGHGDATWKLAGVSHWQETPKCLE